MEVHLVLQVYGWAAFSAAVSNLLSLITKKNLEPASIFDVSVYRTGSFSQHSGDSCCHLLPSHRPHCNIKSC